MDTTQLIQAGINLLALLFWVGFLFLLFWGFSSAYYAVRKHREKPVEVVVTVPQTRYDPASDYTFQFRHKESAEAFEAGRKVAEAVRAEEPVDEVQELGKLIAKKSITVK